MASSFVKRVIRRCVVLAAAVLSLKLETFASCFAVPAPHTQVLQKEADQRRVTKPVVIPRNSYERILSEGCLTQRHSKAFHRIGHCRLKVKRCSQSSNEHLPASRPNSSAGFGRRLLASVLMGVVAGFVQYLCVVSRHIQDCEWTLATDRVARRAFPSYLGSSSGWFAWAFSSGWTWLFADVAHTASTLQAILQASYGLLLGLLAVQLFWSSLAWLRGKAADEKVGIQMWKTTVIWVGAVQSSSACCNFALQRLCVKSSWTGLPYYEEGHALCLLSSILGGVAAAVLFTTAFRYMQGQTRPWGSVEIFTASPLKAAAPRLSCWVIRLTAATTEHWRYAMLPLDWNCQIHDVCCTYCICSICASACACSLLQRTGDVIILLREVETWVAHAFLMGSCLPPPDT